jgi:hypothetical protein
MGVPPSPYPPLYRGYLGMSKGGVNAVTEIFPEIFGEIGTIFLIPIISLHIRGVKTCKWKYISKNRKKNFQNFLGIFILYEDFHY